jgi:hypothetical protein
VVQYIESSAREDAVRNSYRKLVEAGKGVVYKARDLRLDNSSASRSSAPSNGKINSASSASFRRRNPPPLHEIEPGGRYRLHLDGVLCRPGW